MGSFKRAQCGCADVSKWDCEYFDLSISHQIPLNKQVYVEIMKNTKGRFVEISCVFDNAIRFDYLSEDAPESTAKLLPKNDGAFLLTLLPEKEKPTQGNPVLREKPEEGYTLVKSKTRKKVTIQTPRTLDIQ
jgi:hypothetical protein